MSTAPDSPRDGRTRIMIVDACATIRDELASTLAANPSLQVVGSSTNSRMARAELAACDPDVVIVDCVTPTVYGGVFARELRRNSDGRIRVVLQLAPETDARAWIAGQQLNGCDVLLRDEHRVEAPPGRSLVDVVLGKPTRAAPAARVPATAAPTPPAAPAAAAAAPRRAGRAAPDIVVIGTSTGGPDALNKVLPKLPADFPLPVLVVQHMPKNFTKSLAQSLDRACALHVSEAGPGQPIRAGNVLIAPGGQHLSVRRGAGGPVTHLSLDPPENSCRPAVDYLMRSVAQVYGAAVLAVVMTGMGEDGFRGCTQLRARGARIIAQERSTCVVYGMPRAVVENGLADEVVPLDQIAASICAAARHALPR